MILLLIGLNQRNSILLYCTLSAASKTHLRFLIRCDFYTFYLVLFTDLRMQVTGAMQTSYNGDVDVDVNDDDDAAAAAAGSAIVMRIVTLPLYTIVLSAQR